MQEKSVTPELIKIYLDKLVNFFGIYPNVRETALKIQFDHHLYSECVLEIMKRMGIKNMIKLRKYSEEKWPIKNASAHIGMPVPMPTFGSREFNQLTFLIEFRDNARNNFHAFIKTIAHELSHVVLFSTKHELHESEVATDLCAMVFGFSEYFIKGRKVVIEGMLYSQEMYTGYLDEAQINLAYEYIRKLQKAKGL